MGKKLTSLDEVNEVLQNGQIYIEKHLEKLPFSGYLKKLWEKKDNYKHNMNVINSMNTLLSGHAHKIIKGEVNNDQKHMLNKALVDIHNEVGWDENFEALLRIAALYHDIGKYIIKERHPIIGWYLIQFLDQKERENLGNLLVDQESIRLLLTILRDHDLFGVLSTGEASFPILLRSASPTESIETQLRIISALLLCNISDIAGTFAIDGETIEKLIYDWEWYKNALKHCRDNRKRPDEYIIYESCRLPLVHERIRRLLAESSRKKKKRRSELNDIKLVIDHFEYIFGNESSKREFASQFTRICKLDYGKRFFSALVDYCEGPTNQKAKDRLLPTHSDIRMEKEDVVYAFFAILKRITSEYRPMLRSSELPSNLIGVELKDLTPREIPNKTARIIELILSSHYPGLNWMMSDIKAWYI